MLVKKVKRIKAFAEPVQLENGRSSYKNIQLEIVSQDLGKFVAPGYVRAKMHYLGICGTDIHLVSTNPETGLIKTSAPCFIPDSGRIIGHEGSGEILACGEGVSHIEKGDLVAFESLFSCGQCDICRRGKFNQCRNAKLMGLQFDGLFSEIVEVPAILARKITNFTYSPEDLKAASCLEPAGVAFLACENTQITFSDRVVVLGAGPIGAYCAMIAQTFFGVTEVVVVEPVEFRRELSKKWSTRAISPEELLKEEFSFDVLIEASGDMTTLAQAFKRIEPNGRVCVLARSGKNLNLDSMDHMISNNITILGSRGHLGGYFERMLPFIKNGQFPILDVVTKELNGLDELLSCLNSPENIIHEQCKIICKIS